MKRIISYISHKLSRIFFRLLEDTKEKSPLNHDKYPSPKRDSYIHVDLGCFARPRGANFGIDLKEHSTFPENTKFLQCNLGFQKLPLPDESCDFITAFDLLEHIPKVLWYSKSQVKNNSCEIFFSPCAETHQGITILRPAIYLFNEIYRVLKPNGQFLSFTPAISQNIDLTNVNSLIRIHQDPTHVSVWCYESFTNYFCCDPNHPELFQQQLNSGIRTAFKALPWGSKCKFSLPEGWYYVGHNSSHLTMILEKPDWKGKDIKLFTLADQSCNPKINL